MENIVNPYIAGNPVFGDNFYGRRQDLQKVLDSQHKLILFLATRRMGKTSFCHQIKYLCKKEDHYKHNLCLLWNLQGVRSTDQAKRRLLQFSNKEVLSKIDWNEVEKLTACNEIIRLLCSTYRNSSNERKNILLLIDEPEVFIHFSKIEVDFLADLKETFDSITNLRVVIVSPPRIRQLSYLDHAPSLLEHFQTYFLREFDNEDAKSLIWLDQQKIENPIHFLENNNSLADEIIKVSNKIPFYIQQICGNIFDAHPVLRLTQVIESIIEQQTFSPFFTSDFSELHPIQKIILLNLVNSSEPKESQHLINLTKNVAPIIAGQIPTLKYIDELVSLGILKKNDHNKYHFSNSLFDRWILRDFDNLWNRTMNEINIKKNFDRKIYPPGCLKKKDLIEMKAKLESFRDGLKSMYDEYSDGKLTPEFYFKSRLSMIREHELLLKHFQDHLSAYGIDLLSKVLRLVKQEKCDENLVIENLKKAAELGHAQGWGEIILKIIRDESMSETQMAIEATFEVAIYVIENN